MMLKFFIRYHKESEIFVSFAVLLEHFKKFNKFVDITKSKVYPRTCHEILEGK